MEQIHPAFEEVVERAFSQTMSKREEFDRLIRDLVVTAEEVNEGRTSENWDLFEIMQKRLLYFILINQDHVVFV